MNANAIVRTLGLCLCIFGVAGCTFYPTEREDRDRIVLTVVRATATAVTTLPPTTPPTNTPLTISTRATEPQGTESAIELQTPPLPTPSPDATVTPFVVLYLTPTNEWQSVQVAESIIIEIPAAWTYFYPTGGYGDIGNGATFYDSNAASMPGTPATWVLYTQSPPNDRPPDEYPLVVDGYPARFGTWTDDVSGFGEPGNYPLWIGSLSIRTPERIHTLELRCNAPNGELGEAQQHAYHESCEAIRRHWAETTQIIE